MEPGYIPQPFKESLGPVDVSIMKLWQDLEGKV